MRQRVGKENAPALQARISTDKKNGPQHSWKAIILICGDGRSRTAVQTTCREAFYTLILPLVVGRGMPEGGLSEAYPLGLDLL